MLKPFTGKATFVSPQQLGDLMAEVIEGDPGTERKIMLFCIDGRYVRFVGVRSEARITVMELTEEEAC